MKRSLSMNIRQKITLTFVFVIILLCSNTILGVKSNRSIKSINQQLNEIYFPISETLKNIDINQVSAIEQTQKWMISGKSDDKQKLRTLINEEYMDIRVELGELLVLSNNINLNTRLKTILESFDEIASNYIEMMNILTTRADFENNEKFSSCKNLFERSIVPVTRVNRQELNELMREIFVTIDELNRHKDQITSRQNYLTYIITGIIIIIIVILIIILQRLLLKRINNLRGFVKALTDGKFPDNFNTGSNDEIGKLEKEFDLLNIEMQNIKDFIIEIGKGNFDTKIGISKNSEIGKALEEMRSSLLEIAEKQEEQKKEEELRNWITSGIAHFNEILRLKTGDVDELSYEIIKELVKYTDSVIGGVYIAKKESNDVEKLVMSGLFAYERKRYVEVELSPGEGLIGTSYIEKHKIHMRQMPEDYIKISSGLGEAPPNELLIVPVMKNDNIYGVIEIATLSSYNNQYIQFIERIAESLASTISSVIINTETVKLLAESNEKAEQLHSQEEELRQNMEELQTAQEEKSRQTKHMEAVQQNLEAIIENLPFPVFLKDENCKYIMVNSEQSKLFNIDKDELLGKNDEKFINDPDELAVIKKSDFEVLHKNKKMILSNQSITISKGKKNILKTIKIPIKNSETDELNILGISYNMNGIK